MSNVKPRKAHLRPGACRPDVWAPAAAIIPPWDRRPCTFHGDAAPAIVVLSARRVPRDRIPTRRFYCATCEALLDPALRLPRAIEAEADAAAVFKGGDDGGVCDHGKREDEECSACEYDRMSDGETDGARL